MIRHGMQQNSKMVPQRNGLSLQSPLRPLSVLVFHLLLTHSVTGQSQLIGSPQPIVATVGDDIILPCHLEPAEDIAAMTLLWTRSDLDPEFVFVWRFGQDLVDTKHPSYKGRTFLFTDELKRGNISLKLSDVRPSDAGRYRCFIPDVLKGSFIELVVDDFFKVQSSSSSTITGLAVSLAVCIMFIVLLLILLWKWRQNIIKTKRRYCDETEEGKKKNSSQTNKTEDQSVPAEEREHLMTTETVQMKIKKQRCLQQLLEEQRRREVEKEVQTLKEELETKKKEVATKQSKLQQLHEEKQRNEDELKTVKEELENKNKESHHMEEEQLRREVETLKIKLETKQMELDTKIKKIDAKQAEVQQLQNQIQRVSNLQTLMETLSKNMELERSQATPAHSSSSALKWPIVSGQKFQEEQQRREDAENKVKNLMKELQTQIKELERNKQAAERELKEAQRQLKNKDTEISELKRDPKTNESVPVQHGASSPTGPVIVNEVDPCGRYIRLKNISNEEQQLRDWEIHVQVNNLKPITCKFDDSPRLQSGETVTMWPPGYCQHYSSSTTNLEWRELKSWSSTDQLQITLISNTGEIQHQLVHNL